MDGGAVEGILYSLIIFGVAIGCGGVAIVGCAGCILALALYSCGCLVCPQHDNHDIPMEVIQSDLESVGNDSDLAEAI